MKKIIRKTILVAAIMATFVIGASVVSADTVASGECGAQGDNLTWTLDDQGTLTISGYGEMADIESGYATGNGYAPSTWTDSDYLNEMKWHSWKHNYKSKIQKIVIQSGVTSVGQYAFYGCSNINSITIPKNGEIGAYAFYGCTGLTTMEIPDGTVFAGLDWNLNGTCYAFQNCTNLKTLTIGKNVNLSSQAAFMGCTGLTSLSLDSGATISSTAFKNCNAISTLTINTGTQWTYDAFQWCSNISTVNINGTGAFKCVVYDGDGYRPWAYSNKVSTVNVNEGVTELDQGLFYCASPNAITKVTLPSTLTKIGRLCFYNSTKLTTITIPRNVTSIGDDAFGNVNAIFKLYRGSYADTYLTNLGKSVSYIQESISDATVTLSNSSYLYDGNAKTPTVTVKIGDTKLINEKDYILSYTDNIEVGTAHVIIQGKGAYSGNKVVNFSIVKKENSLNYWPAVILLSQVAYEYDGTEKTPKVTVTNNGELLSENIDYSVSYNNNIDVGNAVVKINGIGKYCGSVTAQFVIYDDANVIIENGTCGNNVMWALYGDMRLVISGNGEMKNYDFKSPQSPWRKYAKTIASIDIGKSITTIGNFAFDHCYHVEKVEIPDQVTSIGESAFSHCYKLQEVNISQNVVEIGNNAFINCKSLEQCVLPDGLKTIGNQAFVNCKFENVIIPNTVTSVGKSAFSSCEKLQTITISNRLRELPEFIFSSCSELNNVEIPSSVKKIDDRSFVNCYKLKSITIPCSVNTIGNIAIGYKYPSKERIEGVVMYGVSDSAAKKYAEENEIEFVVGNLHNSKHYYNYHDASCNEPGNYAYWQCTDCNKFFSDEECMKEISKESWVINTKEHMKKEIYDPPGLLHNGQKTVMCTTCGTVLENKILLGYSTSYVKSFKVSKGKKCFTANWKKQSKANQKKFNGYQIRYSTSSNMSGAKTTTASKSSKSKKIKKLLAKKKYYVQVRTYTKKNGSTFYSKWSSKKAVTTKK